LNEVIYHLSVNFSGKINSSKHVIRHLKLEKVSSLCFPIRKLGWLQFYRVVSTNMSILHCILIIQVEVFWVMMSCSVAVRYQCFGGVPPSSGWRLRQQGPLRHWNPTATLRGVTAQMTTWIFTTVKTTNITCSDHGYYINSITATRAKWKSAAWAIYLHISCNFAICTELVTLSYLKARRIIQL